MAQQCTLALLQLSIVMEDSATRRVGTLARHLAVSACTETPAPALQTSPVSSGDARPCTTCGHPCINQGGASTSYASATGSPTSYARVHGEVSRAPASWERIPVVCKEILEEVKYDKAEGIAKVSSLEQRACHAALSLQAAGGAAASTSQGRGLHGVPRRSPSTGPTSETHSRRGQVRSPPPAPTGQHHLSCSNAACLTLSQHRPQCMR